MLKNASVDKCLSRALTFKWFQRFKGGRNSADVGPRCGRPSISRNNDPVKRVRELSRANRQFTVCEISAEVGICYGTRQAILTDDLTLRRVSAKFFPRVLTTEQKEHHLSVATYLLKEAEVDQKFITGDEIWVYSYCLETKGQSLQWK
jgi:hypothetical protein